MTGLTGVAALAPLLANSSVALAIDGTATVTAVFAGVVLRRAIAVTYVGTVVRMEGLAAGNLDASIDSTGYRDCVGQMTRVMFTFRETAQAQIVVNERAELSATAVHAMSANVHSLAGGDLTADITANCPPELADLEASFNSALANLRNVIGGVTESANELRTGAEQLNQASEDLARRTGSNAASLEQTSATLVQIEGRIKASATASVRTVTRADQTIASVGGSRATAEIAVKAISRVSSSA